MQTLPTTIAEAATYMLTQCDRLAVGWVEVRNPKTSSLWFRGDASPSTVFWGMDDERSLAP